MITRITIESNVESKSDRAYSVFWGADSQLDGLLDAPEWAKYITDQLM
jgi:hypothetical protein